VPTRPTRLIRWPAAGLDKPRDINELTHSTDVLPTLLDMCGLEKPSGARFDGLSLKPLIDEKVDKLPDRKIVIQYRNFERPGVVLWEKWRLVHDKELYDMAADPGQKDNVIEKHPDVARALREHYAQWREEMAPLQEAVNYVSIGVAAEPETFLCSANWIGSYADSWGNGLHRAKNGYWDLQVEKSGTYEIDLYGWPKGSDVSLSAKFPAPPSFREIAGRPVARAKLKIGEQEFTAKTADGDTHVSFKVPLKKDARPRLQSWFSDAEGKDLGGAYFVYVRYVSEGERSE